MSEDTLQPPVPEQPGEADSYRQGIVEQEPVAASLTPESLLPPEAQGEANGGPLGCCLGVTVGLLLSLSIAIVGRLYGDTFATLFHGYLAIIIRVVMAVVAIGAAIVCGYFGWKIGKRFYREYESPVVKNRRQKARARRI